MASAWSSSDIASHSICSHASAWSGGAYQDLARRQEERVRDWPVAVLSFPMCDVPPAVLLHMPWQELLAFGGSQEDPPRLSDQPLRRILEPRSQRWLAVPVFEMLIAREQKLDGWAGRAWPCKRAVNEQILLAIVIAKPPL